MNIYRLGLVAAVVAAGVGWASPALAADGSASVSGGILSFTAGESTVNSVAVRLVGASYTIDDTAPIVPGAGCFHPGVDTTLVHCKAAGVTELRLWTLDGNDFIDYLTPTFSRLFGGDGNDRIIGGSGMDWLFGGNGSDTLNGWSGDDQFYWDAGADGLTGGSGWDYVIFKDAPAGVTMDPDGVADDGVSGEGDNIGADIERLEGSAFNDWVVGSDVDNELFGGGGSDILLGQGGNDDLYGDMGSGTRGADYFSGGPGFDEVSYSDHDSSSPVIADLDGVSGDDGSSGEGDTIASDVEALWGSEAADWLIGNNSDNTINGGYGEAGDIIIGHGGNDSLNGWAGPDYILGGEGNDSIWGAEGNDTLRGDNGSDALNGGPGTDSCDVGAGGTSVTACE